MYRLWHVLSIIVTLAVLSAILFPKVATPLP
jgi:hypothetical protein